MTKGIAIAIAVGLLEKPISVAEERLARLSDDDRELVVAQMLKQYHTTCALRGDYGLRNH